MSVDFLKATTEDGVQFFINLGDVSMIRKIKGVNYVSCITPPGIEITFKSRNSHEQRSMKFKKVEYITNAYFKDVIIDGLKKLIPLQEECESQE